MSVVIFHIQLQKKGGLIFQEKMKQLEYIYKLSLELSSTSLKYADKMSMAGLVLSQDFEQFPLMGDTLWIMIIEQPHSVACSVGTFGENLRIFSEIRQLFWQAWNSGTISHQTQSRLNSVPQLIRRKLTYSFVFYEQRPKAFPINFYFHNHNVSAFNNNKMHEPSWQAKGPYPDSKATTKLPQHPNEPKKGYDLTSSQQKPHRANLTGSEQPHKMKEASGDGAEEQYLAEFGNLIYQEAAQEPKHELALNDSFEKMEKESRSEKELEKLMYVKAKKRERERTSKLKEKLDQLAAEREELLSANSKLKDQIAKISTSSASSAAIESTNNARLQLQLLRKQYNQLLAEAQQQTKRKKTSFTAQT